MAIIGVWPIGCETRSVWQLTCHFHDVIVRQLFPNPSETLPASVPVQRDGREAGHADICCSEPPGTRGGGLRPHGKATFAFTLPAWTARQSQADGPGPSQRNMYKVGFRAVGATYKEGSKGTI